MDVIAYKTNNNKNVPIWNNYGHPPIEWRGGLLDAIEAKFEVERRRWGLIFACQVATETWQAITNWKAPKNLHPSAAFEKEEEIEIEAYRVTSGRIEILIDGVWYDIP